MTNRQFLIFSIVVLAASFLIGAVAGWAGVAVVAAGCVAGLWVSARLRP